MCFHGAVPVRPEIAGDLAPPRAGTRSKVPVSSDSISGLSPSVCRLSDKTSHFDRAAGRKVRTGITNR
ncbi:hypothetical protein EMEDMD4_420057 [Sinorhizobium medicae]|uniref:Uncharacterized protein n=1 Tax=Sinorhizobium medicae TaxID=110321 RepID=A0A508WYN3_9HYPH|nr:hypothetical protein EMEDMD4_420057 [Sinorhizobium medicae]